ncbi:hypothetical protein SAZ11_46175 [Streptomyces sp. FXJ1.4098]|uniref:Uncharacterized protein n=1 Tax=Streptomyces lonegramiae TaxID=3075524 RepID=A0ABU2XUQ8_9ACTN|nr:hypothetical protein [Streptomyces sp. DSM 41529]MDT0549326.1 hypothetical protein [Streptomyces sp. DSM 41529]MDW6064000.1 hypothetical protein [Streptomyces sp. FXJ1.4098]
MTEPTETEETRLRRALTLIGEEAGRPDPVTAPTPPRTATPAHPPRRRRRIRAVLAVAATACAAAIATTVAVTVGGDSGTEPDTTGRGQTFPEALACATNIVEGDLTSVRPAGHDRVRVTMSVDRWFKPGKGPTTTQFDLADPTVADPAEAYAVGEHLLLFVPRREGQIADVYQGKEVRAMRERITRTLPEAAHTTCPPEFR